MGALWLRHKRDRTQNVPTPYKRPEHKVTTQVALNCLCSCARQSTLTTAATEWQSLLWKFQGDSQLGGQESKLPLSPSVFLKMANWYEMEMSKLEFTVASYLGD